MSEELIKLNLGSGDKPLEAYVNLDAKFGDTVWPIWRKEGDETYGEGVDEIRASHVLEHFPHGQTLHVLKGWASKLKPGGVLKIAVPDFGKIVNAYSNGHSTDPLIEGYLMGGQTDEYDYHKAIFNDLGLRQMMQAAGLVDIKPWTSEIQDCASLPVSLNLMGTKPDAHGPTQTVTDQCTIPLVPTPAPEDLAPIWTAIKRRQKNVYSQFGEDGAVEAIFEAIGTANRVCLEVGAGDGIFFSNTRQWVEKGWRAILIEKDPVLFERLKANATGDWVLENIEIGTDAPNSLDAILAKHGAPKDIDLLSLDIDGPDWHVFNAMLFHRPRVVVMEYAIEGDKERYFGPDFIPTRGGKGQAGRNAVAKLLCGKGYKPVAVSTSNVIAVQGELIGQLRAWADKQLAAEPIPIVPTAALQEQPQPRPTIADAAKVVQEFAKAGTSVEDVRRNLVAAREGLKPESDKIEVRVAAVMSVPRLTHTNNAASMFATIKKLGIPCLPGQGVFWHHVLTRQIEDRIRDGAEIIIAVDFDSWFLPGHVLRLIELLVNTPQADAICAVQCQREHELPIMAIHDEGGLPVQHMPRRWFETHLTPIHIGHFGLTAFRATCFAKLERPWFRDEPDPNGSYRDGRKDADVAFWGNFERAGCKLFMANEVNIGHLQEVCTFPGSVAENWKPTHVYLRDLNAGQIPAHCEPAYRISRKE